MRNLDLVFTICMCTVLAVVIAVGLTIACGSPPEKIVEDPDPFLRVFPANCVQMEVLGGSLYRSSNPPQIAGGSHFCFEELDLGSNFCVPLHATVTGACR